MLESINQPSVPYRVIHLALCVFALYSFALSSKPGHTSTAFEMVVLSSSDATYKRSLQALAKNVDKLSSGGLKLVIKYVDNSAVSLMKQVAANTAQITAIPSGALSIPALQQYFLLHGPYQIPLLLAASDPPGLKYLGASFRGSYGFVGRTSFATPERFKGMRIVSDGDISALTVKRLRATATNAPNAFVAKRIDGFETRLLSPMLTAALNAKDAKLTMTNHRFWSDAYFINPRSFNDLPLDRRKTLVNAFDEHRQRHGKAVVELENTFLSNVRSRVFRADVPAYKKQFSPVWDKHLKKGDLAPLLVGGDTGCTSKKKCKCKTDTYGTKCSCDADCYTHNDCKDKDKS